MLAATSSSLNANNSARGAPQVDDIIVFIALESLGTLAITGNICLIVVLLRNKYLQRASFILMLSLAIADIIHGIVTTSYFYPPILLKRNHMPPTGVRIFNILDWTAWSITLTHMSAICLDRLIAIMIYGRYNLLVTVPRIRFFTLFCWMTFFSINIVFIFFVKACCLITPLENNHFYTFGYGEFESKEEKEQSAFQGLNLFTFTYSPLEMTTLTILSISNPTTLIQLYRRHKRKIALRIQTPPVANRQSNNSLKSRIQWQRASTMLLEMSMRMGSKHINDEVRNLASKRANRQQQRILLQISVVACLFYSYMATYYLLYHVFDIENKWVVLFNSFFYSTTHMMNPLIYFTLNKEMRVQLIKALTDFMGAVCCIQMSSNTDVDSQRKASTEPRSSTKLNENSVTETSPLFNANISSNSGSRQALLISSTNTDAAVDRLRISEFRASLKKLVSHNNNSTTVTCINISSTTEEVVDSTAIDETDTSYESEVKLNGILRNRHPPRKEHRRPSGQRKNNGGSVDSNDPTSPSKKSDEETLLVDGVEPRSLLKYVVDSMNRIVFLDRRPVRRASHSQSLDQISGRKQRLMKLSKTVHTFSQLYEEDASIRWVSRYIDNELAPDGDDRARDRDRLLLKESIAHLIDDNPNTVVTEELDSTRTNTKCTPGSTPEDDVIFL